MEYGTLRCIIPYEQDLDINVYRVLIIANT